jgi:hypothetical protein
MKEHFDVKIYLLRPLLTSVADPHRKKNADADPGKNLNVDPDADADSCSY